MQVLKLADAQGLLARTAGQDAAVVAAAREIVEAVAAEGDAAVQRYTQQFDGVQLDPLWLSDAEWDAACNAVEPNLRRALEANCERIREFHALQRPADVEHEVEPGLRLGRRAVPLRRAACYVPGGRADYPSTVLMTVVPAALAEVPEIIVVTPPRPDGTVSPAVCLAARMAGAHRILRVGGAQAIAAVALGTPSVPACDVVVGPGNAYVTAAKGCLQDRVRIDSMAGPSELLIVADETADPAAMALDLVAQAEHDPDARVVLITTHAGHLDGVQRIVRKRAASALRKDIIQSALEHAAIVHAPSLAEALAFADAYAPEHLSLFVADPESAMDAVRTAGSVFLGTSTPVSLGDYGSGTNHVLPTMGQARIRSGLSVADFMRTYTWQACTPDALARLAPDIVRVAVAEGLQGHADAVTERLERTA